MAVTTDRIVRKKRRVRSRIFGTHDVPKISVNRSNKYIYAQAIDDEKRVTIASIHSMKKTEVTKSDRSKEVGKELAQMLVKKGVKKAVFDRGQYIYLGRVKAFVEGLREGGLQI